MDKQTPKGFSNVLLIIIVVGIFVLIFFLNRWITGEVKSITEKPKQTVVYTKEESVKNKRKEQKSSREVVKKSRILTGYDIVEHVYSRGNQVIATQKAKGKEVIKRYDIDVDDVSFKNVDSFNDITSLVMYAVALKTGLGKTLNISASAYEIISNVVILPANTVGGTAKGILGWRKVLQRRN